MTIPSSLFKRYFLGGLVGSLAVSGLIAAGTILFGEFTELISKVLFTLAVVITHSLIGLFFIWEDENRATSNELPLFMNVFFAFIVLSFLVAIGGVWEIIDTGWIQKFYWLFSVFIIAALHRDVLSKMFNTNKWIDGIIYANYIFIEIVVLMLIPLIFAEMDFDTFEDYYFRILGASAVLDGVLSLLAIILSRLHWHNNPGLKPKVVNKGFSLVTQLILPILIIIVVGLAVL